MSHKTNGGQAWSPYIAAPDHYGFFKFNNANLHSLNERDFEAIVDNEERWAALRQRMDDDFADAIDMFPFEREAETQGADRNWIEDGARRCGNALKWTAGRLGLSDIDLPRRYFAISRDLMERRFPGGRTHGDPGDGDLRDMIGDFRILFKRNFANYIVRKRLYQLASVAAFSGLAAMGLLWRGAIERPVAKAMAQGCDALRTICDPLSLTAATDACLLGLDAVALGVVSWVYGVFSGHAYQAYRNAQTESCKTLDKQAALRTKTLSNLISTLLPRIDKDQGELLAAGRIKAWPERARKWVLLVYWLGRRQENLERYTQLEIWRIRRAHYYYRIADSLSNHLLLAATGAGLGVLATFMLLYGPSLPFDPVMAGAGAALALTLAACQWRLSAMRWNTDLDLIEATIDVANWDRFEKVRLAERLADQVFRDKQYLLQREDWVAGKNR
ncbi:MAG: hypothetical protein ACXU8O_03915 [Asticcacaulis sp.]